MNNYNSIVFFYRFLVKLVFGNQLDKAQTTFISELPNHGSLLFIGGGDGNILSLINSLKPNLHIDYVDQSSKMISAAKKRVTGANVNFICGNETQIPPKQYDAIITFFFLDLFKEKKRNEIVQLLELILKPEGIWLIADFNYPINWHHRLVEKVMFAFLKITTNIEADKISDYRLDLKATNLKEISTTENYGGFVFSSVFKKETKSN